MAEYIERDAALIICEKEYQKRVKMQDWCGDTVAWNIGHAIKALQIADVVPVVRCRDCKHFLEKGGVLEPWCDWHEERLFDGDGFCSDGERKDGGE